MPRLLGGLEGLGAGVELGRAKGFIRISFGANRKDINNKKHLEDTSIRKRLLAPREGKKKKKQSQLSTEIYGADEF